MKSNCYTNHTLQQSIRFLKSRKASILGNKVLQLHYSSKKSTSTTRFTKKKKEVPQLYDNQKSSSTNTNHNQSSADRGNKATFFKVLNLKGLEFKSQEWQFTTLWSLDLAQRP